VHAVALESISFNFQLGAIRCFSSKLDLFNF